MASGNNNIFGSVNNNNPLVTPLSPNASTARNKAQPLSVSPTPPPKKKNTKASLTFQIDIEWYLLREKKERNVVISELAHNGPITTLT